MVPPCLRARRVGRRPVFLSVRVHILLAVCGSRFPPDDHGGPFRLAAVFPAVPPASGDAGPRRRRAAVDDEDARLLFRLRPERQAAFRLQSVPGVGLGRGTGFSFNGPIWSVSVEVFLYGLFFAACRLLPVRAGVLAGLAALGLVLQHACGLALGRGMLSFFTGGCVYFLYRACVRSPQGRRLALLAGVFAAGAWVATFAAVSMAGTGDHSGGVWTAGFGPAGALVGWAVRKIGWAWPNLVLFPATILALARGNPAGHVGASPCFSGRRFLFVVFAAFPLATGRRDRLGTQRGRCGRVLFPWIHGGVFRGFAGVGSGQLSFFRDARAAVLAALGPSAGVAGSGLAAGRRRGPRRQH